MPRYHEQRRFSVSSRLKTTVLSFIVLAHSATSFFYAYKIDFWPFMGFQLSRVYFRFSNAALCIWHQALALVLGVESVFRIFSSDFSATLFHQIVFFQVAILFLIRFWFTSPERSLHQRLLDCTFQISLSFKKLVRVAVILLILSLDSF